MPRPRARAPDPGPRSRRRRPPPPRRRNLNLNGPFRVNGAPAQAQAPLGQLVPKSARGANSQWLTRLRVLLVGSESTLRLVSHWPGATQAASGSHGASEWCPVPVLAAAELPRIRGGSPPASSLTIRKTRVSTQDSRDLLPAASASGPTSSLNLMLSHCILVTLA
jgi:hypothetical protein